jgi:hypothetical protein
MSSACAQLTVLWMSSAAAATTAAMRLFHLEASSAHWQLTVLWMSSAAAAITAVLRLLSRLDTSSALARAHRHVDVVGRPEHEPLDRADQLAGHRLEAEAPQQHG